MPDSVEVIKRALVEFPWWDYGLDNVSDLADEDPDIGVFDDAAIAIATAFEGSP